MKSHKVGDICRITFNCSVYGRLCEIVEILENEPFPYHVKIVDTETFTYMTHDELVLVEANEVSNTDSKDESLDESNSGSSELDTVSEMDRIITEANEADIERFLRSKRGKELLKELLVDIIGG